MLKKYGLRMLSLNEYLSVIAPSSAEDNDFINQIGMITSGNDDEYYPVRISENTFRLMPGPEFSPRLYRGQTFRFQPCRPGSFRPENFSYSNYIYWSIKCLELWLILKFHPAVGAFVNWKIDGLRFGLDMNAIAQHYQYPTRMLDLSRSRDVAMYFATHKFGGAGRELTPAIGHNAVLYTLDIAQFLRNQPISKSIIPVGLDPLPRSAAQRAFGLELYAQNDFEKLPGVQTETFEVTPSLAQECAERVGGYQTLFPPDDFEPLVNLQRDNQRIAKEALELSITCGIAPKGYGMRELQNIIVAGGYHISHMELRPPPEALIAAAGDEWNRRRASFIKKIRTRAGGDHINTGSRI